MKKIFNSLIYFLLFVPPLVFFTDATRNPYYFQIFLLNILILVFWTIYIIKSLQEGKLVWASTPLDLPLYCFTGFAVFTTFYAYFSKQPFPAASLVEEGRKLPEFGINFIYSSIYSEGLKKIIFTIVNILLAFLIPAVFVSANSNKQEKDRFLNVTYNILFAVGFITSAYGLLQYFGFEPIWPNVLNPFGGRPVSTFGNPNFMSSYLMILFPLILSYYFSRVSSSRKIMYFVMLAVYFACILATLTRSSWVGLFVAIAGIGFYLLGNYSASGKNSVLAREKRWIYIILVPLVVFFVFWPKSFGGSTPIQRIVEIKKARSESYGPLHQRILIWSCAWSMVKEKPILGKGWGLYELFYPLYQGRCLFNKFYDDYRTHANNAHNEILEYWSQIGTLGLGFYLWFFAAFFAYGFHVLKNIEEDRKILAVAIMSGTAGMIFDNIFGNVSTQFCTPAFLFWWNIGALVALDDTKKTVQYSLKGFPKILLLAVIVLFAATAFKWYDYYMGEVNYFKGFKYSKRGDVAAAKDYLEAAHSYNREVNSEYELANCYARMGMKDKAVKAYFDALAANFGYDELYFNLATVLLQENKLDQAYEDYSMCLYINPLSYESYISMETLSLKYQDRYLADSSPLFENAVYFFPKNMDFWNNLGYVYNQNKQPEKALDAYRRAVQINPDFDRIRDNLRSALKKAGITRDPLFEYESLMPRLEQKIGEKQWAEVISLAREIIGIFPESYKSHFYLANALYTSGEKDEAISEYEKCVIIDPDLAPPRLNLGIAFAARGDYAQARDQLNSVLQRDPGNKAAQEQLRQLDSMPVH